MNQNASYLPYASYADADASALSNFLRRLLGSAAAFYGVWSVIERWYLLALSRKWVGSGVDFGQFDSVQNALEVIAIVGALAMALAGVLILRRSAAGILILRAAVLLLIATNAIQTLYSAPVAQVGWSFASLQVIGSVDYAILPILLATLTFGSAARAIRGK